MKIKNDLQQDTITIRPRRVYKCSKHNGFLLRKNVHKDAKTGKYFCNQDNAEVSDVTDTQTGQDLMEILCI